MYRHVCTLPAAALLAAGITILTPMAAWATDSGDVATLALANAGKGAGLCSQVNPAPNSLGGAAFGTSCTGNQGEAEYWCADFAKWVWQNAAGSTITDTGDLDAGAVSFYNYGVDHYEMGGAYGHIAIGVEDAYAACDKIRAAGGTITREPGPVKGGNTVIAFVTDPDGYKIELIQRDA